MSDYAGGGYYGVGGNEDLLPNIIKRPRSLPLTVRLPQMVAQNGFMVIVALLALNIFTMLVGLWLWDLFLILSVLAFLYCKAHVVKYPFRTPAFEFKRKVKKGENPYGDGMLYLGNDRDNGAALFFTDSDLRTHMLVMGSTGSGKTRFLLALLYQALLVGSGAIYVDGKADNSVFWWVYSICRRLNRADDLLIINYLTGGETILSNNNAAVRGINPILTNTMNPFATGTAEQLRSMVVGLMRESGGDGDMWKGRASSLLAGVLRCLSCLRDLGYIQLSVTSIRDALPLDNVLRLVHGIYNQESEIIIGENTIDLNDIQLPDYAIRPLKKYLLDLPGYSEMSAKKDDIAPECYKQHGFLTMQLTESLGDLGETYSHIFNVPIGEVDFKDVVFNRRILFVMLPSLERDPDALANLGKLVVSGVRSALGPALGDKVEGRKRDVIDVKPTNSLVPFMLILDEYGYYSVKGFAVCAAQARSLGVGIVFAGQDYPSFKKGSPEEAASTVANTNIKICMKIEDSNETLEIFTKRVGMGYSPYTSGYERREGQSAYYDQRSVQFKEIARLSIRDLSKQLPGQGSIIFQDTLVRANLFAMLTEREAKKQNARGLHEVDEAELNRFLMVRPPSATLLRKYRESDNKISGSLYKKSFAVSATPKAAVSETGALIKNISDMITESLNLGYSSVDSGIHGLCRKVDVPEVQASSPNPTNSIFSDPIIYGSPSADSEKATQSADPVQQVTAAQKTSSFSVVEDQLGLYGSDIDTENMRKKIEAYSLGFEALINENLKANGEEGNIRKVLEDAAYEHYGNEEESKQDAERAINMIDERLSYAAPPVPQKMSPTTVSAKLANLLSTVSKKGGQESTAAPTGLIADFDDEEGRRERIAGISTQSHTDESTLLGAVTPAEGEILDDLLDNADQLVPRHVMTAQADSGSEADELLASPADGYDESELTNMTFTPDNLYNDDDEDEYID